MTEATFGTKGEGAIVGMAGRTSMRSVMGGIIVIIAGKASGRAMADLAYAIEVRVVHVAAPSADGGETGGRCDCRYPVGSIGLLGHAVMEHDSIAIPMWIVTIPAEFSAVIAGAMIRAEMGGIHFYRAASQGHSACAVRIVACGTGLVTNETDAVLSIGTTCIGQTKGIGAFPVIGRTVVAIEAFVLTTGSAGKIGRWITGSSICPGRFAMAG